MNLVKPVKNSLRKKDECAKSIIADFKMESVESVHVSVLRRRFNVLLKNVYVDAPSAACKSVSGNVVWDGDKRIKNKFDYLSHIEFSDGIDALGLDPEAQLSLNACDPFPGISYQKLIAGETYYVQLTGDDDAAGIVEVRINDLGGGSADAEDIPCQSPSVTYGTNVISTSSGAASVTLDFGCAYDGGNDYAETGAVHTDNNPIHYHAYDYY